MAAKKRDGARRRPTVKEVAELAGVSPMTVSRTISGTGNVNEELKLRVLAAARQLGYRRNDAASRMRVGRGAGMLGVIVSNLQNPFFAELALGIEEVAAQAGIRILLGNSGEDQQREISLIQDFVDRQVEGLIIVPANTGANHLRRADFGSTPAILALRDVENTDLDTIMLDDVNSARRGTQTLIEAGHRRIAFLGHAASVSTANRRYTGFALALADAGIEVDPQLVRRGQIDAEASEEGMAALMALPEPPTAVFCANNRNALGAVRAIIKAWRATGEQQPAMLSFDDFELAELVPTRVTVIDHDTREFGRAAARMLLFRMDPENREAPARRVEFPTRLVLVR